MVGDHRRKHRLRALRRGDGRWNGCQDQGHRIVGARDRRMLLFRWNGGRGSGGRHKQGKLWGLRGEKGGWWGMAWDEEDGTVRRRLRQRGRH